MRIFDIFKSKTKARFTPEQTLKRLVDYMPYFYTANIHFKNCVEFLEYRELGLALDSLLELASESGHYFAEEFWLELANAADKMRMIEEAEFCRKQIERNVEDIKFKTPFGWTTVKFDETHFEHHISEKFKAEWATKRHVEDNVLGLINQDGIHLKSSGRSGFIYFVDKGKVAEIEFELGMPGLIAYFESVAYWILPTKTLITKDEKVQLKQQLRDWADRTKNVLDFI